MFCQFSPSPRDEGGVASPIIGIMPGNVVSVLSSALALNLLFGAVGVPVASASPKVLTMDCKAIKKNAPAFCNANVTDVEEISVSLTSRKVSYVYKIHGQTIGALDDENAWHLLKNVPQGTYGLIIFGRGVLGEDKNIATSLEMTLKEFAF